MHATGASPWGIQYPHRYRILSCSLQSVPVLCALQLTSPAAAACGCLEYAFCSHLSGGVYVRTGQSFGTTSATRSTYYAELTNMLDVF